MMDKANEKLIPQTPVHEILCAIQGALGAENQRVFAKAGMSLGKKWGAAIPRADDIDDLMEKAAAYLKDDLLLAGRIELEKKDHEYIFKVRGCCICHGALVRERHGIKPACAIFMFPVGAAAENLKTKSARLSEIRKAGGPGDCDLVYDIRQ